MIEKTRLDVYLFENGLSESRERARALVMAGLVYVNGQKALKPGTVLKNTDEVTVRGGIEFVSRGGHKLKKAVEAFSIDLNDKICMDVGASTGGFTDCMLQNGARKVYCVDVGYGQLAWKLRSDGRVVNLERTNIRYVTEEQIPDKIDFSSIDVSFISLELVLPIVYNLLNENGEVTALIKPQFEAGREKVGKKGVVREMSTHIEVIEKITRFAQSLGFALLGLTFSPIKGPEGNIEYLLYASKDSESTAVCEIDTVSVAKAAHDALDH
ncbi:MAG: TlyA family RNA methyltransferase [Oscillospiraceae bacterium]|jgi:23S rRNA (cytidine1920-2'-O)/16S rRNA (cytidine1409-2'-O)-methyltransferase|nr:TlyA family RNA methyltransferase [Oscillospiraceae bacterium]